MGALEQLAADIMGEEAQKAIALENPYLRFMAAPQAVNETLKTFQPQTRADLWNKAAISSLSGLLGSGLEAYGGQYQDTLSDRYTQALQQALSGEVPTVANLPVNLFRLAKDKAITYNTTRQAGQQELADAAAAQLDNKIKELMLTQPYLFRNRGVRTGRASGAGNIGEAGEGEGGPIKGTEGNIFNQAVAAVDDLIERGVPGGAATNLVNAQLKTKREELDRQYKRIEAAEAGAEKLKKVANDYSLALQGAGDTGQFGRIKQSMAGLLGYFGNKEQQDKYAEGKRIGTLESEMVDLKGPSFKGPMSDRDIQIMLRTGPSLTNPKKTNESILQSWNYIAKLQQTYAEYMRMEQEKKTDVSKAEAKWQAIKEAHPYVIKEGGKYKINPEWLEENPLANFIGQSSSLKRKAPPPRPGESKEEYFARYGQGL